MNSIKRCPYCAEEIHNNAIKCKYCGEDLHESKPNKSNTVLKFIGGLIVIALIIVFITSMFSFDDLVEDPVVQPAVVENTNSLVDDSPSVETQELLEVQSFRVYEEYGYSNITGEVKNISDKALEDVMAVGRFYDDQGALIKSEDALIDFNPILPGQISAFEVSTSNSPAITKGSISFKFLFGGQILHTSKKN